MVQWIQLLRSLGFNESEAKIYLLALEMGPSSVQDIAKRAKVSRVTTYHVIETLSNDGLMTSVEKGKKTYYTAESPERLLSFMQTRVKKMESTMREVESLIGDLKLIQRGEKPVVRLFEGREGLKAIHDDILRTNPKEILEFFNDDAIAEVVNFEESRSFGAELDRRKIPYRIIFTSSKPDIHFPRIKSQLVPGDAFKFFGDIIIYENKIGLSTFQGKNISVIIESEILAQTLRCLFDLASKGAEKTA